MLILKTLKFKIVELAFYKSFCDEKGIKVVNSDKLAKKMVII